MKEFEKWWEKFDCQTIDCGGIGCNDVCKQIRKETWKAALKWVLKHELIDDDGRFVESYFIREELLNNQTDNSPN